jgi:ABC-type branched-subunit amino acid transport system substrate-binding protein
MKRLLVLALALGPTACGDDDSSGPGDSDQLVVGALLSLTGPGRTLGQTSEAALQLAADDLNAQLSAAGSPTRVSLRVQDTGLDPATALDRLSTLADEGVRIFIGPQSSSEIAALKAFAGAEDVVVLSQGSTAGSLSIPDDNVFRLVPDDAEEGAAMVELLQEDGIQTVVPLWREDATDAFTLAAYDALHLATLAYAEVGLESIGDYRAELLRQADTYTGATGPTALNANGDRAVGDYDFYQVCPGSPASWSRVSAYRAAEGTIESVGTC